MAPVGLGAKRARTRADFSFRCSIGLGSNVDAAKLAVSFSAKGTSRLSEPPPSDNDSLTPAGFVDVGAASEVGEGTMKGFDVDGERVLVAHVAGKWCAIGGICTHQIAYLEDGVLEEDRVFCPRHAAAFDLRTGEPLTAPADMPVPVYQACIAEGRILISRRPK
jgi:nitrite reductase/ring-hydroxylating ferredoxin subunit